MPWLGSVHAAADCLACGPGETKKLVWVLAGCVAGVAVGAYGAWVLIGRLLERWAGTDFFVVVTERWVPWVTPKLKIMIVTLQIVSAFQEAFASVSFPTVFASLTRELAFFGFDPSAFLTASVHCDRTQWDYLFKLELYTILPVLFLCVHAAAYAAVRPRRGPRAADTFALLALLVLHLSYTSVSNTIFRSLFCDDAYGDEPDGSPFRDGSWLAADYAVSCRTRRYRWHAAYAIFCVFVYPLGVPLVFFVLLYQTRAHWGNRAGSHDGLVERIIDGGDAVLSVDGPKAPLEPSATPAEAAFHESYSRAGDAGDGAEADLVKAR